MKNLFFLICIFDAIRTIRKWRIWNIWKSYSPPIINISLKTSFSMDGSYYCPTRLCHNKSFNKKSILIESDKKGSFWALFSSKFPDVICHIVWLYMKEVDSLTFPPHIISVQFLFSIFLIGIHSMQGWTATTRHGVTRKKTMTGYRKSV